MIYKFAKVLLICISILIVTVFSAGCIDNSEPEVDPIITHVETGDGFVAYISINEVTLEASFEMYFEDDYIPVDMWESLMDTFYTDVIAETETDGVIVQEAYIYTHIDGIGYTASYTKDGGITYKTGEAKVCPIEIPPFK